MELEVLWAKSSESGGLPLIRHLLDVAAVCVEVLDRLPAGERRQLCDFLSLSEKDGLGWMAVLVGLHDLGKATPGFQAKWPEGRNRVADAGYPFPVGAPDRHDAATSALLPGALRRRFPALDRASAAFFADAVSAHHGHRIPQTEVVVFSPIDAPAPDPWPHAQALIVEAVLDVVQPSGVPRVEQGSRPAAWQLLAGLCAFCDWVGSSEEFFPHDRPRDPLDAWFDRARSLAARVLGRIGWDPAAARIGDPDASTHLMALGVALPPGANPRPLQSAVAKLLSDSAGPAMVLIEAPMGEGKTEAAFVAYALLADVADHRGLYVAMPTQATSNAIYGRVAGFLGRLHRRSSETLQLVHGGATVEDAQLRLRDVGFGERDASVHAAGWFAGSRKGLLAPNAVGTIDQALIAVLSARHSFVRMFGLSDRFVVLDEVHAYDDYTGGLLERLVGWLARLGCSVVVMSATLPEAKRRALARAWSPDAALPELSYPRVCVVRGDRADGATFPPARTQRVRLAAAPQEPSEIARLAADAVAEGGCALVVANTVRRAQQIYEALGSFGRRERLLFHARFTFEDRMAREREVLERFGPGGTGRDRVVLVATQVVEQSLDVDFDVMFSDLAPIDLLLQRVGRLHRHARVRLAHHSEPMLHVVGLGSNGSPPIEPRRVYDDWPVLRTVAVLRKRQAIELPRDIDPLVQQVYSEADIPVADAALEEAIGAASTSHAAQQTRQAELAAQAALPMPGDWVGWTAARPIDDADAELSGRAGATRLGEPTAQVVPVFDLGERWSIDREAVTSWLKSGPIPMDACRRLAVRYLRVSRYVAADIRHGKASPSGWAANPLTEPFEPLVFDAAGFAVGQKYALRIDSELGLVIDRTSP